MSSIKSRYFETFKDVRAKIFMSKDVLNILLQSDIWVVAKCDLGKDGWILAKSFFCVFMDRDGDEVHKVAKKRGQYPAIFKRHLKPLHG